MLKGKSDIKNHTDWQEGREREVKKAEQGNARQNKARQGDQLLMRSLTAAFNFERTAATSASVMSSRLSRSFSLSFIDRAGRYWGASVSSPLTSVSIGIVMQWRCKLMWWDGMVMQCDVIWQHISLLTYIVWYDMYLTRNYKFKECLRMV